MCELRIFIFSWCIIGTCTFLPGSIVAFLVFGPIVDIKMLALMRTTYSTRTLVQLTTVVALLSLALGLVVNYLA